MGEILSCAVNGDAPNMERNTQGKRAQDETNVVEMIKNHDIDGLKQVKPSELQNQNSLEKALKYSSELRKEAKHCNLYERELKSIASTMEEYASLLIDPLKMKKNDEDKKEEFVKTAENFDIDRIAEKAMQLKQKKFLAHPVVYELLRRRWKGKYHKSPSEGDWPLWMFLHLWAPFDMLLFPFIYLILNLLCKFKCLKKEKAPENYHKYFTTPYFIFLRDILSYCVLLALHFAMCIQPPTLHFTVVEYVIFFFFLGRFMMEIYQVVNVFSNEKQRNQEETDKQQNDELSKYRRDKWNVMDVSSLILYAIILILRVTTRFAALNNRLLAVAGYLYAANSIILTSRVFGHIMEIKKKPGTIQIALFQILGAVLTVFGQFFAVLVAFSLAICKIHITAEILFTGKPSTISFENWWDIARHLFWSLLTDPKLLQSSDETSNVLIQILYGLFLILAVVMLMNMLTALLTKTYHRIEDNALYEWSYKKTVTIITYYNYHPVPVPFNIISLPILLLWYLCKKICCPNCSNPTVNPEEGGSTSRSQANIQNEKSPFDKLISDLESDYKSKYGDNFPKPVNLDRIVKQTDENHLLIENMEKRLEDLSDAVLHQKTPLQKMAADDSKQDMIVELTPQLKEIQKKQKNAPYEEGDDPRIYPSSSESSSKHVYHGSMDNCGPEDHSSVMLKQVLGQLSELKEKMQIIHWKIDQIQEDKYVSSIL